MGFQKGDVFVTLAGQDVCLRLTLGALAEMSERLSITGIEAFNSIFHALDFNKTRIILDCVMRPTHANFPVLSEADVLQTLPKICELFEHAFS